MAELPHRFVTIPPDQLSEDIRRALLGEFVTRQGYDTTDTEDGENAWVDQLEVMLGRGELLIIHDLQTEMSEVMTKEQLTHFGAEIASLDDFSIG